MATVLIDEAEVGGPEAVPQPAGADAAPSRGGEEEPFFAFTGQIQKLSVANQDPAFRYYWFNDYPGRVEQAHLAGYRHVTKGEVRLVQGVAPRDSDLGSVVSTIVGRTEGGEPLRAYLMKCPKELAERADRILRERVDRIDRAIREGMLDAGGDRTKFYWPGGQRPSLKTELVKG